MFLDKIIVGDAIGTEQNQAIFLNFKDFYIGFDIATTVGPRAWVNW